MVSFVFLWCGVRETACRRQYAGEVRCEPLQRGETLEVHDGELWVVTRLPNAEPTWRAAIGSTRPTPATCQHVLRLRSACVCVTLRRSCAVHVLRRIVSKIGARRLATHVSTTDVDKRPGLEAVHNAVGAVVSGLSRNVLRGHGA